MSRSEEKLRAETGGSPPGAGVGGAAREPGNKGRRCQAGSRVLQRDAMTETTPEVRAVTEATSRGQRAAAAVINASPAELASRVPCVPGGPGAPLTQGVSGASAATGVSTQSPSAVSMVTCLVPIQTAVLY